MTKNRARAYGRVTALIDELGPAKLHAREQQTIRDAADAVLFTNDITSDREVVELLDALDRMMDGMVESGRMQQGTADDIVEAVERCGPQTEPLELPTAA